MTANLAEIDYSKHNILVVDDDDSVLHAVKEGLERQNFNVLKAANGQEAIALVQYKQIDGIITDICMPNGDGIQLIETINLQCQDRLPVILCITGFSKLSREEAFSKGVDAYFKKPVMSNELVAALKNFLKKRLEKTSNANLIEEFRKKMIDIDRHATLGSVTGNICHEIKTPLSAITTYTEWIQELFGKIDSENKTSKSSLSQKGIRYSKAISMVVSKVQDIVETMESFSNHAPEKKMKTVSVKEIVADITTLCCPCLHKEKISFTIEDHTSEAAIKCHSTQICQVLINLIKNAGDAIQGQKNPWITVIIEETFSDVVFKVSDSGPGIPSHMQSKIFEPFFTTKDKDNDKGLGFGLAISKKIAEFHQGTISIDTDSENTCFLVRLPKRKA